MVITVFDIGNVLLTADQRYTVHRLIGLGVSPESANRFFQGEDFAQFSRGRTTAAVFCGSLRTRLGLPSLTDEVLKAAHDAHITGCVPQVLDLLSRLDRRAVVVLTDTNEWQTAVERRFVDLDRYARRVVRSHEIGLLKSDAGCFEATAKRIGAESRDLLLVDDRPENVARARAAGWSALRFVGAAELAREFRSSGLLP